MGMKQSSFVFFLWFLSVSIPRVASYRIALTSFVGNLPNGDGKGEGEDIGIPSGISISPDDKFAVISDQSNHLIRLIILSTGSVTTLAGSSGSIGSTNGIGTNSKFNFPFGLSLSPDGDFALIADRENNLIRQVIISSTLVTTFAGSGLPGSLNGIGTNSRFNHPFGVSISPNRTYALIADSFNNRIRLLILSTATVSSFVGSDSMGIGTTDGIGTNSRFNLPVAIAFSPNGCYALVADYHNHLIRRIVISTRSVSTIAGNGFYGSVDGIGTNSGFQNLLDLSISPDGRSALISDYNNHSLRHLILSTATVTTFHDLDHLPTTSTSSSSSLPELKWPTGVSISRSGRVALVLDAGNRVIRSYEIDPEFKRIMLTNQSTPRYREIICPRYTASNTNTATTNVATCGFMVCPREYGTVTLYGSQSTYVTLFNSKQTLIDSIRGSCDDFTSFRFHHNSTTAVNLWDCELFSLRQGCWESNQCEGDTKIVIESHDDVVIRYSFGVLFGDEKILSSDSGIMLSYFSTQGRGTIGPIPLFPSSYPDSFHPLFPLISLEKVSAKPISFRVSSSKIFTKFDTFPSPDSILIKWRPVYVNRYTHNLSLYPPLTCYLNLICLQLSVLGKILL
jgi:DNA-binding beta-propeller fold protein YncE